jgi:hypothetical protein
MVQFGVHSSEGDLLHETKVRDQLAFLMNELDLAYQAPTVAEETTYSDLRAQADSAVTRLRTLMR